MPHTRFQYHSDTELFEVSSVFFVCVCKKPFCSYSLDNEYWVAKEHRRKANAFFNVDMIEKINVKIFKQIETTQL